MLQVGLVAESPHVAKRAPAHRQLAQQHVFEAFQDRLFLTHITYKLNTLLLKFRSFKPDDNIQQLRLQTILRYTVIDDTCSNTLPLGTSTFVFFSVICFPILGWIPKRLGWARR